MEYLRNVTTGEVREVERDTPEFRQLIREVYDHDGSARPRWEQTGAHHVERVDTGDVDVDHDLGYEDKPRRVLTTEETNELRPEANPERALTPAERESGIESWEQKSKSLGLDPTGDDAERIDRGLDRVGTEDGSLALDSGSDEDGNSGSNGPTKADLQEQARERGLSTSGNKADLQARIDEYDAGGEDDEEEGTA